MKAQDKAVQLKAEFPTLEITIIGKWVWVSGDTLPMKDLLKARQCFWCPAKKRWAWKESAGHSRGYRWNFNRIRHTYGEIPVEDLVTA